MRVFKGECMSVCVCSLNIGCVFPFDRMVEGMKCINIDEANYFTLENWDWNMRLFDDKFLRFFILFIKSSFVD